MTGDDNRHHPDGGAAGPAPRPAAAAVMEARGGAGGAEAWPRPRHGPYRREGSGCEGV